MKTIKRKNTKFFLTPLSANTFDICAKQPDMPIPLSEIIPILESFGVYTLKEETRHEGDLYSHHYTCQGLTPSTQFIEALQSVWLGEFETDSFNQITLKTSLSGHDVNTLRAYGRYLQQALFTYGMGTIAQVLADEAELTNVLWALFTKKFKKNQKLHVEEDVQPFLNALSQKHNPETDKIFRSYLSLIQHTLRLQSDEKAWVAFKFHASEIKLLPEPKPKYESFIYTPYMEGVHLRADKVARGGIRWSEREDYRNEVLGLFKAQVVKNSIIVPAGAKGGFICRKWGELTKNRASREERQQEKEKCYDTFIQALLDLTDNISATLNASTHSDKDPYFVVAADKGTATFSDRANVLSNQASFWLKDAFASGGSNGYDHKKMGITARGAWVSLRHHCKRLGLDHTLKFIGIGDMSGDVFGNGLLEPVKLVAAFNHEHVFIDPNPDTEKSFEERKRLFYMPHSKWSDYDPTIISNGGGVFSRNQHSIDISQDAADALAITPGTYDTNEVIKSMLRAPVDVIWLGGIGTFIRGETDRNAEIYDRNNDDIRVLGQNVRAKIIVEGANLGITQNGRTEYALAGGTVNTDAVDNSAGVDCSDHEVNIKIFLRHASIDENKITKTLQEMEPRVAELVLHNNQLQNDVLSIMETECDLYEPLRQYLKTLNVRDGMPSGRQLKVRIGQLWTRPELCFLLAHLKNALTQRLINVLPNIDHQEFSNDVIEYFPKTMQKEFGATLCQHPLYYHLLATILANHIINTWGPLWALPANPIEKWLPAYAWIRKRRKPNRNEAIYWHIMITYLEKKPRPDHAECAYQFIWGKNSDEFEQSIHDLWSMITQQKNIPATWALGAYFINILISAHLNKQTVKCPNTLYGDITFEEVVKFVLSIHASPQKIKNKQEF